jgi:NTE family protein
LPDAIVFAGAKFHVCTHVGYLRYLEELDMLSSVTRVIGTSSGSIIALCCVLGMSSRDIEGLIYSILDDPTRLPNFTMATSFIMSLGIDSGACVNEIAKSVLRANGIPENITFADLFASTRKHLEVVSCKMEHFATARFSHLNTPSLPVHEAIRASCSLPMLFTPVLIGGDVHVDGGITENCCYRHCLSEDDPPKCIFLMHVEFNNSKEYDWDFDGLLKYVTLLIMNLLKVSEKMFQCMLDMDTRASTPGTEIVYVSTDIAKHPIGLFLFTKPAEFVRASGDLMRNSYANIKRVVEGRRVNAGVGHSGVV